jgi:hypothetical protein
MPFLFAGGSSFFDKSHYRVAIVALTVVILVEFAFLHDS